MSQAWLLISRSCSCVQMWERGLAFINDMERKGLGHRLYHVQYRDVLKDPIQVVKNIHEHFNLAPVNIDAVQQWLDDNPQGKHGTQSSCKRERASPSFLALELLCGCCNWQASTSTLSSSLVSPNRTSTRPSATTTSVSSPTRCRAHNPHPSCNPVGQASLLFEYNEHKFCARIQRTRATIL